MAFTADTGYPIRESVGSLTMLIYSAAGVTDTSTLSLTGFDAVAWWASCKGNPGAGEEGANLYHTASATGSTITVYLSTTSDMMLYVLGRG